MVDKNHIEYTIREIKKNKFIPYQMGNESLAEALLPYVKQVIPEARLVKLDKIQWFIVSKKSEKRLLRELELLKAKAIKALYNLDKTIAEIKNECEEEHKNDKKN